MDIDIDVPTKFVPTDLLPESIPASMVRGGKLSQHPCGIYLQTMPTAVGIAAIPYDIAPTYGFFKIDFLSLSLLDGFSSKSEMRALMRTPVDWTMLQDPAIVSQLFQLHKHYDMLRRVQPSSVLELADCVALIRPAKKHLINAYTGLTSQQRNVMRKQIYEPDAQGRPQYKKAHAVAYALTITLQMRVLSKYSTLAE